uniref:NADH dehydrogenase subunit 6 n=1 Tax=Perinereis cultrifera TaxID=59559 RepID=A0A7G8JTK8_PERCL|nr:NADH dehydrogenase subunit 6 [Perinereis cultrifera]QNJ33906.1 NADH dehydrogenase subunit 6 [Perinereis cultrifera]
MTLLMINSIIITLFISCMMSVSPINLGILIILVSLSIAIAMGVMSTGWFGLITFIIYVGGMLVMFAYFAALQPNQYITSWAWFMVPSFSLIITAIMWAMLSVSWLPQPSNPSQIYSNNLMLPIFMALILFLALIMVVKTSRADEGPLRPFH